MGKGTKRLLSLLLCGALLLCAAGCKSGDQDGAGEEDLPQIDPNISDVTVKARDALFTLGYDADKTMHPLRTTSSANALVDCLVYEFAVEVDQDFQPVPNLILDWRTENGISWFFTVDTTVTFHDGSTLTAGDVSYSINQARNSSIYGPRLNKVWGVSALNEDTVMITLADTNYMFPRLLNIPVVKNEDVDGMPIGSGPYQVDDSLSKLTLYEDYRNALEMPIDVIYLHENGDREQIIADYSTSLTDLVVNDPTGLSRLGYGSNNEVRYFPTTNMQFIGMNTVSEFTCYQSYRYALNFAVDRAYIADSILGGSADVASLPVCPENSLYNTGLAARYAFDPDNCKRLFSDAGVRDYDEDGMLEYQLPGGIAEINLDFIVCSDNTDKVKAARRIAADLESIGIGVTVRQLTWEEYNYCITNGDYDMFYGEVKLTADFNLTDLITTNGVKNFFGINDPNYYEYVHSFLSAQTDDERHAACDYMCQYIADGAVIIPICFEKQQVLTHRDVVSGIEATQYNVFYNLKNWSIDLETVKGDDAA